MLLLSLLVSFAFASAPGDAGEPYTAIEIASRELGETRTVWVALPRDYALATRSYPLTIVLDGQDRRLLDIARATARANAVLDFFDPEMPDQIIVGIESADRGADFGRNADAFRRFLESELIPMLATRYRVAGRHTLVGHSLGGAFAIKALCDSPETFYGVVAISPALRASPGAAPERRCMDALAADPGREHAVYVARGERANDATEDGFAGGVSALVTALGRLADTNLRSRAESFSGWSHARTPLVGVPAGLAFVLADGRLEVPDSVKRLVLGGDASAAIVADTFARRLARRTGVAFAPQARWFEVSALLSLGAGRPQEALAVLDRAVAEYPERIELHLLRADAARRVGDREATALALTQAEALVPRLEDVTERERRRLLDEIRKP